MKRVVRKWTFWLKYNWSLVGATCLMLSVIGLFITVIQDDDQSEVGPKTYYRQTEVYRKTAQEEPAILSDDNKRRHLALRQRCAPHGPSHNIPVYLMNPVVSQDRNLFFCPLAKAGSTFFTRYLINIDLPGEMKSPYSVSIEEAPRSRLATLKSLGAAKQQFFARAYKTVFTREPYARLFSAYVDKLYSPNPYFWSAWGVPAVKAAGLDQSKHKCGSGVPFSALVKLVVKHLYKKDMHFIPMYRMCKFCETGYDFVGKMEHAVEDIDTLSQLINVSSAFQHEPAYKMATALDVIHDSLKDALDSWWKEIISCITAYDAGRLIWRRLQIRGIIYKDIPFPFTQSEMEQMSPEKFSEQCIKAAERSTNRSKLKGQKLDAIRQAYSHVSKADMESLRSIYRDDFYLLNYDPKPDSLYGSGALHEVDIFDWTKEWT